MGDETLTRVSRGTGRRLVAVIPLKGRREGREGGVKGQAQMPDLKSGKRGGGVLCEWAIWPPQTGYAHVASSLGTCQGKAFKHGKLCWDYVTPQSTGAS